MSTFSAFGLTWRYSFLDALSGQWALPAASFDDASSILITEGDRLSADAEIEPGLQRAQDGTCLLSVPGIAQFCITSDRITVHALAQAESQAVQLFLFGSAMGVVLHLRGVFPLHGSTVCKPDGTAAVFCGHSRAGKSTTVAALGQRGLASVADDVSAIRLDEHGQAWVYPGLPRMKLWGNALKKLGLASGAQIRPGMDKYHVDLPVSREPVRLTSLYELQPQPGTTAVLLDPISGMQRVSTLLTHTYRPPYIKILGLQAQHMARVARLASQFQMARIRRPQSRDSIQEVVDLVLKDWA